VAAERRLVDREELRKTGAPWGALRTATIECGDREYPTWWRLYTFRNTCPSD